MILSGSIITSLTGSPVFSSPIPALERFLEEKVLGGGQHTEEVCSLETASEVGSINEAWDASQEVLFYRTFFLRVQAKAGVQIPFLINVQIIPEVELVWQRSLPEDWGMYRPDRAP